MVGVGTALSCWGSSGFDLVSLASVGILVSGSAPAAWLLLSRSLKWRPSSSVQIRTFNWPPAPWTAANYSSPSFPALHCMSFSCIAHTILSLTLLFCVHSNTNGLQQNFCLDGTQKKACERHFLFFFYKNDFQCHWGKIAFSLVFILSTKGDFTRNPRWWKKKVLPQTLWHKNERRTQGKMRSLQRW